MYCFCSFSAKCNLILYFSKNRTNLENGSIWEDLSSSSEAMEEAAVPSSPRPEDGELEAVIVLQEPDLSTPQPLSMQPHL
jgi:hypothetical protein